ncbi:hypothetical protein GOV04_05180 [Candidatus Woesearchaeota archaeon]|nr:hypothetical protein [Candidatus Woesearchaeota archaeon]
MKKIILLTLLLVFLTACGSTPESTCESYCNARFQTSDYEFTSPDLCTCNVNEEAKTYLMTIESDGAYHFTMPDGSIETTEFVFDYAPYEGIPFSDALKAIASAKVGGPFSMGYTPDFFMSAYPELQNSDFHGVKARQGTYRSNSAGGLTFYVEDQVIGSKSKEITVQGFTTLENKLKAKHNIDDNLELIKLIAGDDK